MIISNAHYYVPCRAGILSPTSLPEGVHPEIVSQCRASTSDQDLISGQFYFSAFNLCEFEAYFALADLLQVPLGEHL